MAHTFAEEEARRLAAGWIETALIDINRALELVRGTENERLVKFLATYATQAANTINPRSNP